MKHRDKARERDETLVRVECPRCGFPSFIRQDNVEARQQRMSQGLCRSCKAGQNTRLRYGDLVCWPHQGEFDLDDRPMKKGVLFLPGDRVCGHTDCVNPDHVQLKEMATSESQ